MAISRRSVVTALVAPLAVALAAALGVVAPGIAHADDGITVTWSVVSDTGSQFTVSGDVRNDSAAAIVGLSVVIPFAHTVSEVTGLVSIQDGSSLILEARKQAVLKPGDAISFTLSAVSGAPVSRVPSTCSTSGLNCEVVLVGEPPAIARQPANPAKTAEPQADEEPGQNDTVEPSEKPSPSASSNEPSPRPSKGTGADPGRSQGPGPPIVDDSASRDPARLRVTVERTSDWGAGQVAAVAVRNDGPATIHEWSVEFDLSVRVIAIWNAESTSGGGVVRAASMPWNGSLKPGEATTFGFTAAPGGVTADGSSCSATSDAARTTCALVTR